MAGFAGVEVSSRIAIDLTIDVVARVEPLGADWVAIVAPYYVIAPDDVREGLRIGISIIELSSRKSIRLTDNCIDPKFVYSGKTLAMTCVTETAADNLLHKVMVFDLTTASILAERLRCRSPRVSETKWVCFEEHLDRAGILHLKQRRLP